MGSEVRRQVEEFFDKFPIRRFKKGEILIFAGEAPAGIFYLKQGSVRQYDVTHGGDEVVVNIFKPPAFFSMNYAINRRPNEYFFDAAESVTAHVAPVDAALDFVRENHEVAFDLLTRVYNGIDGVLRRQTYLMGNRAGDRLIYELVLSCLRLGKRQPNGTCLLRLNEAELAVRVGLSRETVSRHLQELKNRGLLQVVINGLIITDVAALEKLLEDSS